MATTIAEKCRLLREALSLLHKVPDGPERPIQVQEVFLINGDTLVASFVPYGWQSIDIKTEIATIMAALSAWFKKEDELSFPVARFGVRAYSNDGDELMYALSSLSAADAVASGEPIRWLQGTLFQDTTDEFRRHFAQRKVDQLETGLRLFIRATLHDKHGSEWPAKALPRKVTDSISRVLSNASVSQPPSEDEILEYSFLLDLRQIVISNWDSFFAAYPNQRLFYDDLKELNRIRRIVSHSRSPLAGDIQQLERISERLMAPIAATLPELIPEYLTDNWRTRLAEIVDGMTARFPTINDADRYRLEIVASKFEQYTVVVEDGLAEAMSLMVPPGKGALHERFTLAMETLGNEARAMLTGLKDGDVKAITDAAARHEVALESLREFHRDYLLSEA